MRERARDLNRHFRKEDFQMARKYVTREPESKITVRYHPLLTKVANIKKTDNTKCWWSYGANETLADCS